MVIFQALAVLINFAVRAVVLIGCVLFGIIGAPFLWLYVKITGNDPTER